MRLCDTDFDMSVPPRTRLMSWQVRSKPSSALLVSIASLPLRGGFMKVVIPAIMFSHEDVQCGETNKKQEELQAHDLEKQILGVKASSMP
jgi:hypothetical protein